MISRLAGFFVWALVIIAAASSLQSKQLILEPQNVTAITSPTDSRDTRVLVYFELPKELYGSRIQMDNAFLVFSGQVTDGDFGMVEVFPVKKDWKSAGSVSWDSPWDSLGGDYSKNVASGSVTLKRDPGDKEIELNVTFIVKGWLDGVFANNGLVILPCQADLRNSSVKYDLKGDGIRLKIWY